MCDQLSNRDLLPAMHVTETWPQECRSFPIHRLCVRCSSYNSSFETSSSSRVPRERGGEGSVRPYFLVSFVRHKGLLFCAHCKDQNLFVYCYANYHS